ncbi:MAG: ABC transporter ATP-binding protein [Alphaproteobacteria bacterium]
MTRSVGATSLPIRIVGASKQFGAVTVLDNVHLDIAAGEFVTLLGPSGSGKTTILNIVAGFIRPEAGWVYFGDDDVTLLPPHRRNLGVVFQNYALFPHMSVNANVAFPLEARKYPRADIAERVKRALGLVQLDGYGQRRIDQLSGGQRQRVALARAVVFEPKIILMDEPLSALDKQLRELMQIELRRLHAKLGATTVYVTHDQREALTMSDRVAVLNQGRIAQFDTPRNIYERPADRFVAEFLGESTLIPVERSDAGRIRFGSVVLESAYVLPDAAELALVVRAESLQVADAADVNRLPGRLNDIIYQGDSVLVLVQLAGGAEITMRAPAHRHNLARLPAIGQPIELSLHPQHTVVVAA